MNRGIIMLHDRSNKKILEELNSRVYGHEEAKKSLISLVNRSKLRHFQKWGELLPKENLINPGKCLLIGGSGTGKTHLLQTLADIVHFPLLIVDATSFNPTGATGGIKAETLKKMITAKARDFLEYNCSGDTPYFSLDGVIDQMVVFVDEFDKISTSYDGSSGGNWNRHLQTHFLTMFENHDELAGVSWIFAGAFSGMGNEQTTKKNIGFTHSEVESSEDLTDEDIVKYGLLPEIVGRLTSICRLDKLTENDFYNILIELVVPKKVAELAYFKVRDIDLTEEQLRTIAQGATKSSQGVRYLYREIEKHFLDVEFNYEEIDNAE